VDTTPTQSMSLSDVPVGGSQPDAHLCLPELAAVADHELAAWVRAMADTRSEQALAQLYAHTIDRVHSVVRRFIRDEALVEEVCADVFYQAWVQAQRFDTSRGPVMAWLLNTARSRALDAWRKQSVNPVVADDDLVEQAQAWIHARSSAECYEDLRLAQAVHQALKQVSPAARQMIALAFFQGLTHSEISAHLAVPLGTVKTTIRRALLSLRDALQTHLSVTALKALSIAQE
jgi:RNA polymerase sigma factor (sigma-70 family)